MSELRQSGTFPVYQPGPIQDLFVRHPRLPVYKVQTPHGETEISGYLKVESGTFNLFDICKCTRHNRHLQIESIAYVDNDDNIHLHEVVMKPVEMIGDDARVAAITKLNNLRWGVEVRLNAKSGQCSIEVDFESPIIGVKLNLTP